MAFLTNPKILVAVCVYTRYHNLKRWLTIWKECYKYDAKLAVINNFDHSKKKQFGELCNQFGPLVDWHVPRNNHGLDMGAFQDLCKNRIPHVSSNYNWDILYWTSDDCLPLKKEFLIYFINGVMQPRVGVCCPHISDEMKRHVRTNCFCIKREVCDRLVWEKEKLEDRQDCYRFEHIGNTLYEQVERMGLKCTMPLEAGENTNFATWDSGHYSHYNRWEELWKEFPETKTLGRRE